MKPVLLLVLAAVATEAAPHSIWDGVYSSAQASRGQKAYVTECAQCHGDSLGGIDDAPPLVNEVFLKKWNGKSVGHLVDVTRRTMPTDSPGTLSRPLCTDIVAYLLSANGFPAGKSDLALDTALLKQILIEPKK
jgi:mono/diheme cytochrome c family protein